MSDPFHRFETGLESPAIYATPVVPSDAEDMAYACRALNVAQGGIVRVTTIAGDTADVSVAAGIPFPIRASRVWQSGTTASGIVALR